MTSLRRPSPAVSLSILAIVIAGTGVAAADNPAPDGSLMACLKEGNTVRMVTASKPCAPDELAATFNVPGAPGSAGIPGIPGDAGRDGYPCRSELYPACTGAASFRQFSPAAVRSSVYRTDSMTVTRLGTGDANNSKTVDCLGSETRFAGGHELLDIDSGSSRSLISIKRSAPSGGNGWTVGVRNDSAEKIKVRVYVVCGTA